MTSQPSWKGFTTALSGAVLVACAGQPAPPPPAPAPPPVAVATASELPSYAGFQCIRLTEPLPIVFTRSPAGVRSEPWYAAIGAGLTVQPKNDMSTAEFATMVRELTPKANRIESKPVRLRLLGELDQLTRDLPDGRLRIGGSVLLDRWTVRSARNSPEVMGYFEDGSPADITVPLKYTSSDLAAPQHGAYMSEADARILVGITDRIAEAIRLNLPLLEVAQRLQANDTAWANYLERGYPQFPWEGLVNGFVVPSAWDAPPSHQIVLLHPEPGVVLDLDRARTSTFEPSLLVHGLGYLHYFGDDRGWFLGASASASITGEEETGLGYGITLHGGSTDPNSSLPHVSVGLLWHEGESDDGLQLAIGVDLLRLFRKSK